MDINAQFMSKKMSPSIPIRENMLILDPQTKNVGISGGETTTWDIPTAGGANGSYIDMNSSYLELTYLPKAGTDDKRVRLPTGGVHSLFDTIDVESSNFVVEHTDNWARLHQVLADVNDKDTDRMGVPATATGLAGERVATFTQDGSTKLVADGSVKSVLPSRKGQTIESNTETNAIRFCIPIPSQQMNTGSHLPIWAISKLRYSIKFVEALNGVVGDEADGTGFTIDEPRLHLCYLEMSNKSRDVISSKAGLSRSHPLWETHKANTVANVGSQSFRFPSHKSSVKTLMATFHDPSASGSGTADVDAVSRCKNGLKSFQFRLNGTYYPQNEVLCDKGGVQGLLELQRAFHKVKGNSGQISTDNWNSADTKKAGSTFVIATNTETNTGRSNASFAGTSTLQEAPLLLCKFEAATGTELSTKVGPAEALLYVQYDSANTIKDGVWRVDA